MALPKTRFAPSPTGLLHLGNVRTALFNVLLARKLGGAFVLRIEDTDAERSRAEYVVALMRDLVWLGLAWQQGPDRAGADAAYFQSQRTSIYSQHLEKLRTANRVYPCFCTALELEVARKIQAAAGRPPRYGGKCAHLGHAEAAAKIDAGLPHTLRFRVPNGVLFQFEDMVRGPQRFSGDDVGDFIVRRSDGSFAFFFVNALDDALMGVTHVLRGEDHLTNTPRQIALLQALGLPIPSYGHIALIVDAHGSPLSKRSGSLSVQELRDLGYFPAAVQNYLARLGHSYEKNELMTLATLATAFEIGNLGRAPARFDRSQLDYWQRQAVQTADTPVLCQWLRPAIKAWVPETELAHFAATVRDNVVFPHDARVWAEAIYGNTLAFSEVALRTLESTPAVFFRAASEALSTDMQFKPYSTRVQTATGMRGSALYAPLRAALTGQISGPEMQHVFPLLGFERAKARLAAHLLSTELD
ncbi:MAG: glutamate--tRNA ligase [Burkholderiales bacterium]